MLFIPFIAIGQFEQNMSINLSVGSFKTFGYRVDNSVPMQMPNYGMGLNISGGMQFRISKRLSLIAEAGLMFTQSWSYTEGDSINYMAWTIEEPVSGDLIAEGENYLEFKNYSIGIKPVYYLLNHESWHPFVYAGISFNITQAYFEDSEWIKLDELNMLPQDDEGPYRGFLEENLGIGFNPGIGIEYSPFNRIHFHFVAGYSFISLYRDNFRVPIREENFDAIVFQVGTRLHFIKSKDL